jgi:hypothetical protein
MFDEREPRRVRTGWGCKPAAILHLHFRELLQWVDTGRNICGGQVGGGPSAISRACGNLETAALTRSIRQRAGSSLEPVEKIEVGRAYRAGEAVYRLQEFEKPVLMNFPRPSRSVYAAHGSFSIAEPAKVRRLHPSLRGCSRLP